jgi:hypothetical protein
MEKQSFLNTLPPISDRLALETLMALIERQFEDAHRDFAANPGPDHLLVHLLILAVWIRDMSPDRGDRRARRAM